MQLTLKIKDIPESGLHLEGPLPPALLMEALAAADGDVARSQASFRMDLHRAGETISIHGAITGELFLPCTRCLEEAHVALRLPLRVIAGPESLGAEDSVEDEIEYFNHDGERLELEPVLREAMIFAVPMTALCKPDCRGLCTVCGGNRNERDCGCVVPNIDPRLEKLAALKDVKL